MITRMSKSNLRHTSKPEKSKRFLGTTTFDKIGRRHSFVTQVFSESSIDEDLFFRPMSTPGPKLEQFVFTIRKMRKSKTYFLKTVSNWLEPNLISKKGGNPQLLNIV